MKLALSRVHFPVTTLGPGNRLGIWFQGCSIRCPGCISADTWAKQVANLDVMDLLKFVGPWLSECEGVTISGGEPFDQPEALNQLLDAIRVDTDTNILVFSGYPLERLGNHEIIQSGLIDCLISDPFDIASSQKYFLRGSDNQRMTCLTKLGTEIFSALNRPLVEADKQLDVMFDSSGVVWIAGIPRRGDLALLKQTLEGQGTALKTTEALT